MEGDKPSKRTFKAYAIGYFHIDLAEVQTAEGKLYLYVAIDRTSKFAFVQLVERATTRTASDFLEALVAAVPYNIHTVLTDNGIQFADIPKNRNGPTARFRGHPFDRACWRHGIEHRLTKPKHSWTNGQVERMKRTIKDATVKRYHYDNHDQPRRHPRRLRLNIQLRPPSQDPQRPHILEFICKVWSSEPERFTRNPIHQMPGLNIILIGLRLCLIELCPLSAQKGCTPCGC